MTKTAPSKDNLMYRVYQNKRQDFSYLAAKFLLKLPNKPDVNFAEPFPQTVRNMGNHSLTASRNIDLTVDYEKS